MFRERFGWHKINFAVRPMTEPHHGLRLVTEAGNKAADRRRSGVSQRHPPERDQGRALMAEWHRGARKGKAGGDVPSPPDPPSRLGSEAVAAAVF